MVVAVLLSSTTASAQLDPLLFVKRVPPTVIIVMDTSLQMLEDGSGNFYDPGTYSTTADPAVMGAFSNINPSTTAWYKRVLRGISYDLSPGRYVASTIVASPATGLVAADAPFMDPTRWAIMRQGIVAAVSENAGSAFRWGLIRLRQRTPAWRLSPNCDKPARVTDLLQALYTDSVPCNAGGPNKFAIYAPSVSQASYAQTSAPVGTVMVTPGANTGATVVAIANRGRGRQRRHHSGWPRRCRLQRSSDRLRAGGRESGRDCGDGRRYGGQPRLPQHRSHPAHERQGRRQCGPTMRATIR